MTVSVHDLNGNRISEHGPTGIVLREYIWLDGRPLAVIEGGQLYHLHWDHILRPVLATDSNGTVVRAARYLPFGGIDQVLVDTGAVEQNLRFPGQWFQAETGLHQNWHRDYDPTTGRYLQADPLGLVDGASVYGYARQSPGRYVDRDALFSLLLGFEGEGFFGQGLGASTGIFITFCDGEIVVGSFQNVKGGVGVDFSGSIFAQYVGGCVCDLDGLATSVEFDVIFAITGEVGQTSSGQPIIGIELGVSPVPLGMDINVSNTTVDVGGSGNLPSTELIVAP